MIHELKTIQPYFDEVWNQNKRFEHRFNDRNFQVNDILILKEYNFEKNKYSGKQIIARITYLMEVPHRNKYVMLSIHTLDFVKVKDKSK